MNNGHHRQLTFPDRLWAGNVLLGMVRYSAVLDIRDRCRHCNHTGASEAGSKGTKAGGDAVSYWSSVIIQCFRPRWLSFRNS